ncbi:MAG: hypothetical protein HY919_09200 [Elusimicrobia bacterium]|nr:hypothetical protein [Elusimicrobiota bacterium]
MKITKKIVANRLLEYVNRSISLAELVNWAEDVVCNTDYDEKDFELIKSLVSHIGLADVKQFGLTWDDCYEYLSLLGYKVRITVSPVPA